MIVIICPKNVKWLHHDEHCMLDVCTTTEEECWNIMNNAVRYIPKLLLHEALTLLYVRDGPKRSVARTGMVG